jgi:hypothetical protein
MKKLLFSSLLVAFAFAAQAGDAKDSKVAKETSACCAAKTTTQVKSTCTAANAKRALLSPKAAADAPKRL